MTRQLVSAFGVAAVLLGIVGFLMVSRQYSGSDTGRAQGLTDGEAERDVSNPQPSGDSAQEIAALEAKLKSELEQKKLRAYQQELDAIGYISDPSPEEEAFLTAHKSELQNLVVKKSEEEKEDIVDCVDLRIYAKARNPELGFFDLAIIVDSARKAGSCK